MRPGLAKGPAMTLGGGGSASGITGTLTAGVLPVAVGTYILGDSIVSQGGGQIGIAGTLSVGGLGGPAGVALFINVATPGTASQAGVEDRFFASSDATAGAEAMIIEFTSATAAFNTTNARMLRLVKPSLGTGHTITNLWGLKIEDIDQGATINRALETGNGKVVIGDTTDATATNAAAMTLAGGLGIAKKLMVGDTILVGTTQLTSAPILGAGGKIGFGNGLGTAWASLPNFIAAGAPSTIYEIAFQYFNGTTWESHSLLAM